MGNLDSVNNPFITLRNLSTSGDEFTSALGKLPPNLDNTQKMSNIKKSKSSDYSENRAEKLRMDNISINDYSITLLDIDNILYDYFVKVIKPEVVDTGGSLVSVPVRHASPERWSAIQNDGFFRDSKGQAQRPMIIFIRTSVTKDDNFSPINNQLSVPFVKKFDSKNMYDRFSLLTDVNKVYQVHNVTFPDRVDLTYDFTMSTEYVEQMNTLVEKITFASDDYWGDPSGFKFRTKIDSFSNSVESSEGEDRNVTTTFSATVNAFLLPEVFDNKTTSKLSLTPRKIVWGVEYDQNSQSFRNEHTNNSLNKGNKNITLDRKNQNVFINNIKNSYELRLLMDEEFYTIETEEMQFYITTKLDENENDFFVWDYMGNNIELRPGEIYEQKINNEYTLNIEVHESSVQIIKLNLVGV
tara:strand:+ start:4491 stop:5726 length:1236 start_codon:yes stop_codon:yes gene_type:complete